MSASGLGKLLELPKGKSGRGPSVGECEVLWRVEVAAGADTKGDTIDRSHLPGTFNDVRVFGTCTLVRLVLVVPIAVVEPHTVIHVAVPTIVAITINCAPDRSIRRLYQQCGIRYQLSR